MHTDLGAQLGRRGARNWVVMSNSCTHLSSGVIRGHQGSSGPLNCVLGGHVE